MTHCFPARPLITTSFIVLIVAVCIGPPQPVLADGVVPPVAWSVTTADNYAPDVAPAPDGGVYVSVTDENSVGALLRLDAQGAQLWRQSLGNSNRAHTVASDAAGNAFVAGDDLFNNVFLRKYSPTASLAWNRSAASPLDDWPTGIGVDAAGNSYLALGPWATNYSVPPVGTLSTLRRFDANGQPAWQLNLDTLDGTYPGFGAAQSNGTAVDHAGHVVSLCSNYSIGPDNVIYSHYYLSKATLDGQLVWIKTLGDLGNAFSVGVDSQDNIYAAMGYTLLKFNADGEQQWSRTNNSWRVFSLAIGPQDQVYVAGDAELRPYIAEYSTEGDLQWSDSPPVSPGEWISYSGLTVSGGKLIGSAWVSQDGYTRGNLVRAYQIVPEPTTLVLVASIAMFAMIDPRRHWKSARR